MKDRPNAVVQWLMAVAERPEMLRGAWLLLLESDYLWMAPLKARVCHAACCTLLLLGRPLTQHVRTLSVFLPQCATRRFMPPSLQLPGSAHDTAVQGLGFTYDYIDPQYPTAAEVCTVLSHPPPLLPPAAFLPPKTHAITHPKCRLMKPTTC